MPHFVVDRIQWGLNEQGKPLKGSHVHLLGVAYKRDINDVRESPALDILHLLAKTGAKITYEDPYIPDLEHEGLPYKSEAGLTDKADCVVIVTDHKAFNYQDIASQAKLIVDTRNALKNIKGDHIVRL